MPVDFDLDFDLDFDFDLDLLMPVFKFLTPGRKVRTITALTYTFLKNVLII